MIGTSPPLTVAVRRRSRQTREDMSTNLVRRLLVANISILLIWGLTEVVALVRKGIEMHATPGQLALTIPIILVWLLLLAVPLLIVSKHVLQYRALVFLLALSFAWNMLTAILFISMYEVAKTLVGLVSIILATLWYRSTAPSALPSAPVLDPPDR